MRNSFLLILFISITVILIVSIIIFSVLLKKPAKIFDNFKSAAEKIDARTLSNRFNENLGYREFYEMEASLNEMLDRLNNSFVRLKGFTSDVSHELKTPLTVLNGELSLALNGTRTIEEYEETIASALEETIRLTNVVDTLLELAKAEIGKIKLELFESDLSKVLNDIAEDAEILSESKSIIVKKNIQKNVFFKMDNARMHQALLNLVDNAIKFTKSAGIISISLQDKAELVEIEISDTGIGIPEEKIPLVFDRFFREDAAKINNIPGTGLGLSIVQWIVEAHNGKIEVTSQVNKGTTFKIKLPK